MKPICLHLDVFRSDLKELKKKAKKQRVLTCESNPMVNTITKNRTAQRFGKGSLDTTSG